MNYFIYIFLLITSIILSKLIFKINIKSIKKLEQNRQAELITDKFPENKQLAKEMLEILDNKNVKIEEEKYTKTSLYIAITNKIIIADMKNNYARIQTIAHECIHSCQDRTLLMFNFIFSNINILYFIIITLLTILKVIKNPILQIFILLLFTLIGFSVRAYLEIDAMIKARYLAEKYINKKQVCTKEEKEQLLEEYDKINKIGIPFTLDNLLTNGLIKIIIYVVILLFI